MEIPVGVFALLAQQLSPQDAGALFQVSRAAWRAKRQYCNKMIEEYTYALDVLHGTKQELPSYILSKHFSVVLTQAGLIVMDIYGTLIPLTSVGTLPLRWSLSVLQHALVPCLFQDRRHDVLMTEEECLLIMHMGYPLVLLPYQTPAICLAAVTQDPDDYLRCEFKTEDVRMIAIRGKPSLIHQMEVPTSFERLAAIRKQPSIIIQLDDPSMLEYMEAIRYSHQFAWFERSSLQPPEACQWIIEHQPTAIQYLRSQPYNMCMQAIRGIVHRYRGITLTDVFELPFWKTLKSRTMKERVLMDFCEEFIATERNRQKTTNQ